MDKISSFRDEYYFLSNFYKAPVTYNGLTYRNNEAAYQAQKTMDENERKHFCFMNASEAKKTGRHVILRKDWENVKIGIMHELVEAKFRQNPDLAEKLLATGDMYLEEGNTWGDRTWGVVNGVGANNLGRILMEIRTVLSQERDLSMDDIERD